MAQVHHLHTSDDAFVDADALYTLRAALGEKRSSEVVEEATVHMIDRLGRLEAAMKQGRNAEVARHAQGLAVLGNQIGLCDFVTAARNLADCALSDDPVAMAALTARLMRLGEKSLFAALRIIDEGAG